jgi:calcineurin-like phosphoesterase family protein
MKYYIADLHLDHANIIKLCHRPFETIDAMNEALIKNWNARVKPNDEVWILGDFSWARGKKTNEFARRLNGHKFLITGNHDYFLDDPDFDYGLFDTVQDYAAIKDEGYNVILFHYPIAVWDRQHHGALHLYGHVHDNTTTQHPLLFEIPNAYNVGVDVRDYEPKTLKEILGV